MIKLRGGGNPFYALLVIAGVAFVLTACAYGVMAFRQARPDSQPIAETDTSLLGVMDRHGVWILGVQVGLLAVLTMGAIGTDDYWEKRAQRKHDADGAASPRQQE